MCVREIDPKETTRTLAFELWMKAPNPMVTFFKTCCFSKRILFIARGRQVDTV